MHSYMHSYVDKKIYSCKKWVLQIYSCKKWVLHFPSQSIPSMKSMPFDSKTIRLATMSTTLIFRFTFGHSCLAGISPLGELTIIWLLSRAMGRLCFSTYTADMKECDAPESNNTTAGMSLMENVLMTTPGASWASSTVTWLTFL
jgi:hypothetical protein